MKRLVLAAGLAARVVVPMALLTVPVQGVVGQGTGGSVASRVERVTTGTVRMVFAARAGVCGDGMSWYRLRSGNTSMMTGTFYNSNGSNNRDVEVTCQPGPVRVVVVRDGGETRQIRTYVGGRWKADTGITDLGTVPAADAAAWLLSVAGTARDGVANNALSSATLADSTDAASALLRIVGDGKRPSGLRSSAMGWLGEVAGDRVAARLDSIAYEPGDREVRKQAIHALSRRPAEEAVPNLLKMAETLPDRELRKTAVFWLARSQDPRAIAWITRAVTEK
ncbi:MAG TPA: hypothetical protein VE869_16935 [Gemmatimonas sp.]|nr:hypothetical protein [Gemmatimonas sp.]